MKARHRYLHEEKTCLPHFAWTIGKWIAWQIFIETEQVSTDLEVTEAVSKIKVINLTVVTGPHVWSWSEAIYQITISVNCFHPLYLWAHNGCKCFEQNVAPNTSVVWWYCRFSKNPCKNMAHTLITFFVLKKSDFKLMLRTFRFLSKRFNYLESALRPGQLASTIQTTDFVHKLVDATVIIHLEFSIASCNVFWNVTPNFAQFATSLLGLRIIRRKPLDSLEIISHDIVRPWDPILFQIIFK